MKAVTLAGGLQPPGRFGALTVADNLVKSFEEKPHGDGGWISGGFFVLSPEVIDEIDGDRTIWEREPMEGLAGRSELAAYLHRGFWDAMEGEDFVRHGCACNDEKKCYLHGVCLPLAQGALVDLESRILEKSA